MAKPRWIQDREDWEDFTPSTPWEEDYGDYMVESTTKRKKSKLSSFWGSSRKWKSSLEDSRVNVYEFMRISQAVRNIIRIHGVDKATTVRFAEIGMQSAAGCATFEDIGEWKKPRILLGKTVYEKCLPEEVLDVYVGIGLHEASHIKHTRQGFLRLKEGTLKGHRQIIEGLLEDERIERLVGEESPGYAPYVEVAKKIIFKFCGMEDAVTKFSTLSPMDQVSTIILGYIRVPYMLTDEMKTWTSIGGSNPYQELGVILDVFPKTEDLVETIGGKIWDMYERIRKEYPPEEEADSAEGDRDLLKELSKLLGSLDGKRGSIGGTSEEKDGSGEAGTAKSIEATEEAIKKLFEERLKDGRFSLLDMLAIDLIWTSSVVSSLDLEESKEVHRATEERASVVGEWDHGVHRRNVVVHPLPTPDAVAKYVAAKKVVQPHIQRMRNIFQFRLGVRNYKENEQIEGKLHRRRIAQASHTDRVFQKSYQKVDRGVAICLLLDESGSMGHAHISRYSCKAQTVFDVSVLLAEALKDVHGVELEIYSYASCGDNSKDNYVKYLYGKNNPTIRSLGNYGHGAQNYDDQAIKVATDLFIKNTSNSNRMMIVLSDGEPCGYSYGGPSANRATAASVKAAEKKGIHVVQVAIECFDSHTMFKHVIKFLDLSKLISDMRKLFVTIIKRTTER